MLILVLVLCGNGEDRVRRYGLAKEARLTSQTAQI